MFLCSLRKNAERTHGNLTFNRWESVDGLNALALLLFKSAIDRLYQFKTCFILINIYTLYSMIQVGVRLDIACGKIRYLCRVYRAP